MHIWKHTDMGILSVCPSIVFQLLCCCSIVFQLLFHPMLLCFISGHMLIIYIFSHVIPHVLLRCMSSGMHVWGKRKIFTCVICSTITELNLFSLSSLFNKACATCLHNDFDHTLCKEFQLVPSNQWYWPHTRTQM